MPTETQLNQFQAEDEISLIDLIRVLNRRRFLLIAVLAVGVSLAIAAAMLHEQKFLYSASIEVGNVSGVGGAGSQIESTNAVLSKLNEGIIPTILADYASKHGGSKRPSISARSPRRSELLILEGKGSLAQGKIIVELENIILSELTKEQAPLFELEKMDVVNTLADKNGQLQEENALQASLKDAFARTEKLYQLRMTQLGETKLRVQRLIASRGKLSKGDNGIIAQLLVDAEIEKAQRVLFELEQDVNLDLPAARDDLKRQIEISTRKQASIEGDIVKTKLLLENVKETRFVSEPGTNPTPTGASRKAIIAVGIVLSALLAILVVFLAEFITKVRQELAEKEAS